MVNESLLDSKIDNSGLKIGYIVETVGISRQAFDKKRRNLTPFRIAEIYVLCDLLGIKSDSEKNAIFFCK